MRPPQSPNVTTQIHTGQVANVPAEPDPNSLSLDRLRLRTVHIIASQSITGLNNTLSIYEEVELIMNPNLILNYLANPKAYNCPLQRRN